MRKKANIFIVFILVLSFLITFSSASANSINLIEGREIFIGNTTNINNLPIEFESTMNLTDSNLSTSENLTTYFNPTSFDVGFFMFDKAVDIVNLDIRGNDFSRLNVRFLDSDGKTLGTKSITSFNSFDVSFSNVSTILLYLAGSASQDVTISISDFKVFGNYTTDSENDIPDIDLPNPVTSLQVSEVTTTSAKLTWENPSGITGVNIYKNGVLHESLGVVSEYIISGLTEGTQYKYSVSTINADGLESTLSNISFTTGLTEDDIAPPIPLNLVASGGSGSVYLNWDHVAADDLLGYNVYMSGVKLNGSLIKTNFYNVVNLEFGIEYNFQVTAVDRSGNESERSLVTTGTPSKIGLPVLETNYELKDVSDGISSWFGSFWLILAFAIGIPLSFYIASRVKLLFID